MRQAGGGCALPGALSRIEEEVLVFLPERLRRQVAETLSRYPDGMLSRLAEIRVRAGLPCTLLIGGLEVLAGNGTPYVVSGEDVDRMFNLISANSVHAFEEELRNGYITVRGGHRIGMAGKAILEAGKVRAIKHVRSFNIRVTRDCPGAANLVIPHLIENSRPQSSLIVGPPGSGKTTMLREISRLLSVGLPEYGVPPQNVGIADERSEIAGCYRGVPQNDVGPRTDVLDGCPKAEGMMMLIRAMAPNVIITDEIGAADDAQACVEASCAGVAVVASAHGAGKTDLMNRPSLKRLLSPGTFTRIVLLSCRRGPGTVDEICDPRGATLVRGAAGGAL